MGDVLSCDSKLRVSHSETYIMFPGRGAAGDWRDVAEVVARGPAAPRPHVARQRALAGPSAGRRQDLRILPLQRPRHHREARAPHALISPLSATSVFCHCIVCIFNNFYNLIMFNFSCFTGIHFVTILVKAQAASIPVLSSHHLNKPINKNKS